MVIMLEWEGKERYERERRRKTESSKGRDVYGQLFIPLLSVSRTWPVPLQLQVAVRWEKYRGRRRLELPDVRVWHCGTVAALTDPSPAGSGSKTQSRKVIIK